MAEPFLALVTPLAGDRPVDPGYGQPAPPPSVGGGPVYPPTVWPPGRPPTVGGGPIEPPPGVWPPPGHPAHPLPEPPPSEGSDGKPEVWPPDHHVGHPLPPVIEVPPGEKPPQVPGTIWPPVEGLKGDVVILVWVPFVGFRWIVIDTDVKPGVPTPNPTGPTSY